MKVLLINSNRYQSPPVIPIGLEYLITPLVKNGHEVEVLDLCFRENFLRDLEDYLKNNQADLIGLTVRQIDTVLYQNNIFFLEEIREIVQSCRGYGTKIVLGGGGFSIMPGEILDYLKGDYGIIGPGENAILKLLNDLNKGKANYQFLNGYELGVNKNLVHKRGEFFDYQRYIDGGGIIGFETQKGCPESCIYCAEAEKKSYL